MNSTDAEPNSNGVGAINFVPLLAPNAIFLAIFCILLLLHSILAVLFWRFYGYAIGMVGGLLLEFVGYIAKVQLSHNQSNKNAYIMYIIGLTLGPTFISSSLYLGISSLQRYYQTRCFSVVSPKLFSTIFILGDFICLAFIGVGGSLAAIYADQPIGVNLMIVGLATQVFFTAIFCTVLFVLYRRIRSQLAIDPKRWFIPGAALASACLFLRSCWRVAELSDGFNGPLASKEGIFIALDSIPITLMSIILTCMHPQFLVSKQKQFDIELCKVRAGKK